MSDRPSHNLDGLDINLARRIDEVCRQFEADWREGRQPRIEDYLVDVSQEGRPAPRAELEALERELRRSDEAAARGESDSAAGGDAQFCDSRPNAPPLHEESTLAPSGQATLDHGPSSAGSAADPSPARVRYFGDYEIIHDIAPGGMGVVFRSMQVSLNRPVAMN